MLFLLTDLELLSMRNLPRKCTRMLSIVVMLWSSYLCNPLNGWLIIAIKAEQDKVFCIAIGDDEFNQENLTI